MDKLGQEWVSAVVDGEADEQMLKDFAADKESHQQWRDYHIIGDAMRGELPKAIDLDLSANIAAAIALEPAIQMDESNGIDDSNVTSITPNSTAKETNTGKVASNVVPLFKQLGQYAIAASVALVAVVGVQNYNQDSVLDAEPLPVLNTRPLIGSVSPVSLQTGPVQQNASYSNEQVNEQRQRINSYIQDHLLQQRLNNGMQIEDNSQLNPRLPVEQ